MNTTVTRTPGRTWAYAGLIFGAVGSVAANVGHALMKPESAPTDWQPQLGAVAWGVAVAVALLISVEVLARVDWPDTFGWAAVRYAGGGVVGLVAASASYLHLSDLLARWNESEVIVRGGPAIVDGLMVLCSFALMAPDRSSAQPAGSTRSSDSIDRVADSIGSTPPGFDRDPIGDPLIESIAAPDRSATGSGDGSGQTTRSDRPPASAGSGRKSGGRSGRRGRSRGRSDADLRADLAEAQRLGFVDRDRPTAESIRVALQCSPAKARQFRDELKSAAATEPTGPEVAGG